MKRWILCVLLVLGCGRSEEPPTPAPPAAAPDAKPALIQYDEQGRRISRGFQTHVVRTLEPMSEAQQAKLAAQSAAERAAVAVALPPEWAQRRTHVEGEPVWGFDIYRDGVLVRRVSGQGLEEPTPLTGVLFPQERADLRSALAHGSSGSRWVRAADLDALQLRLNRQGRVKLEALGRGGRRLKAVQGAGGGGDGSGGGGGTGEGSGGTGAGKHGPGKRSLREQEIQGLFWLELRSMGSPEGPDEGHLEVGGDPLGE